MKSGGRDSDLPGGGASALEAARVRQVLEGVLDRYAGEDDAARAEALDKVLQGEISALGEKLRPSVLRELDGLLGMEEERPPSGEAGHPARDAGLEEEVERLREEVSALRASAAPGPLSRGLAHAVAAILAGSPRAADEILQAEPDVEVRLLEYLRVMTAFVSAVGRSFLGATAEPDATMSGRIQGVLAAELAGRAPVGSFAALLDQIQHQIGGQLFAFREACERGASNLLKQIAPAAIAAEASRESVSVGGWRPFSAREQWERFEERFEALRRADNLYEAYFDGAFRKAVLELTRKVEEKGRDS